MPIDRTPTSLTMLSLKLKCPVCHFNKSGIGPSGLIVCASLHEQNVIFCANIIIAHLNRPYDPSPPLAMLGCEKPILRPCTNSFNNHNSILNKFNDFNQVRCPNKSCYIKILHHQKAVKRRKNFDFARNKSKRPKSCEIVNSRQNFSHVFLYIRVVLKPAK
jgi:hypothetical protein